MTETYFKAITPEGLDFHTRTVDYGSAVKARSKAGKTVSHVRPKVGSENALHYISVATVATDCTGFSWPARLLEVEAVGEVWTPHPSNMPNKRGVEAFRVIRELPAWQLFGAEGEHIVKIIQARDALTSAQRSALYAEYDRNYNDFWRVYSSVVLDGRAESGGSRGGAGRAGRPPARLLRRQRGLRRCSRSSLSSPRRDRVHAGGVRHPLPFVAQGHGRDSP
jgi:hypothetical protein